MSSNKPAALLGTRSCHRCQSGVLHYAPRRWWDCLLLLILVVPLRCGGCHRRFYAGTHYLSNV